MNSFCFSRAAAVRVVPSHFWGGLTVAVAMVVCLWGFAADGAPPPNDNRAAATALPATISGRLTTASNVDATKEIGEPNHAGNAGGKSIWFRYTSPATISTRIDTVGTEFDTLMAVYVTNASGALLLVGRNDDAWDNHFQFSGGYHQSRVNFGATLNVTYFIAVDGFNAGSGAASGPVVLNWNQTTGAPDNDVFNSPVALTGNAGGFSGRLHNATKQNGEPNHAGDAGGRSVWYRWVPSISGPAVIDTMGSSVDTLLAVYTGNSVAALTLVAENDDFNAPIGFGGFTFFSRVTFTATAGTTYQIAVDNFGGTAVPAGSVALHYSLSATPPANDNFANSQLLPGTKGQANAMTHAATVEAGEPAKAGSAGGRSVWYHWTPDANGQVTFDTMGIHYDSLLAVFTGADIAALTEVASNDDALGGAAFYSRVSFMASAGTTYHIAVDGFSDLGGGVPADYSAFSLNWEQAVGAPPNDQIAGATELVGNGGTITTSNVNAVFEQDEPVHSLFFDSGGGGHVASMCGKSLWFKWTAARSRPVTIDTVGSSYQPMLAVYTGTDFASLVRLTNNHDYTLQISLNAFPTPQFLTNRLDFDGVEGTTYMICVDGWNDGTGRGTANGTLVLHYNQPGGPPLNDNLADAFALTGLSGTTNGFSFDATAEPGEPDHAQFEARASSWYRWTAPVSGWFTFDTLGSPLDTTLGIYTGTEFANFVEVKSNNDIDNSIPIRQSRVSFLASGGVTYQIAVDGLFGAQGEFVLNWAPTAILSMQIVSGELRLTLKVADFDMYKIQESTNLTSWGDVQTVSAGGGPVTINVGPITGIPRKFYRAIQAF